MLTLSILSKVSLSSGLLSVTKIKNVSVIYDLARVYKTRSEVRIVWGAEATTGNCKKLFKNVGNMGVERNGFLLFSELTCLSHAQTHGLYTLNN